MVNDYRVCGVYSPEPCVEVCCFSLLFQAEFRFIKIALFGYHKSSIGPGGWGKAYLFETCLREMVWDLVN